MASSILEPNKRDTKYRLINAIQNHNILNFSTENLEKEIYQKFQRISHKTTNIRNFDHQEPKIGSVSV